MLIRIRPLLIAMALTLLVAADQNEPAKDELAQDELAKDQLAQDKDALAPLQRYVGDWRGVGQPRRGSTRGAWREQSAWIWKFTGDQAMLSFKTSGGKYFKTGVLRRGKQSKRYQLFAQTGAGQEIKFSGALGEDGRLVLVADDPPSHDAPSNDLARVSLRQVAGGDRLVLLYEKRTAADRYARLAEVGYTREGSNFGKGTNYVECVVTGGLGTIPVSYEGQTYYVCCSGCRDYFNENAAEVLAEYQERKTAEKEKQAADSGN